jgi:hypothetical protein
VWGSPFVFRAVLGVRGRVFPPRISGGTTILGAHIEEPIAMPHQFPCVAPGVFFLEWRQAFCRGLGVDWGNTSSARRFASKKVEGSDHLPCRAGRERGRLHSASVATVMYVTKGASWGCGWGSAGGLLFFTPFIT